MGKRTEPSKKYGFLVKKGFLSNYPNLKTFWVLIISIIIISGMIFAGIGGIYLGMKFLFENLFNILITNFGRVLTSQLLATFMASFILALVPFVISLIFFLTYKIKIEDKKWFFLTIYLVFFVIIFGFFALHYSIGNQELSLKLFDSQMGAVGTIKCEGTQGPLIIEERITCKIGLDEKKEFNIKKEEFYSTLYLIDGNIITTNLKLEPVVFTAIENVTYISFEVYETYLNGTTEKFTVGYPYSFISKEDFEKNRERFLQAFLALIAVALVTVPIVMINFRNLWRNKN
jgi:hypothetical protein